MSRWWVSWFDKEDSRPKSWPPPAAILGFWCSGYMGDQPSVCALVQAASKQEVQAVVEREWTVVEWWFCEERGDDYLPGDRFPLPDWSKERIGAKGD